MGPDVLQVQHLFARIPFLPGSRHTVPSSRTHARFRLGRGIVGVGLESRFDGKKQAFGERIKGTALKQTNVSCKPGKRCLHLEDVSKK